MKLYPTAAIATCYLLTACATAPDKIEAAYISPVNYESFSCEQLREEAVRISNRAAEVTGAQQKRAENDAVAMGVALILFWPAIFALKGKGGAIEQEVASLKGQMEAVRSVSEQKACGITFAEQQPV